MKQTSFPQRQIFIPPVVTELIKRGERNLRGHSRRANSATTMLVLQPVEAILILTWMSLSFIFLGVRGLKDLYLSVFLSPCLSVN